MQIFKKAFLNKKNLQSLSPKNFNHKKWISLTKNRIKDNFKKVKDNNFSEYIISSPLLLISLLQFKNKKLSIIEKSLGLEPVFQNTNTRKIIKNISSIIKSSIDIKYFSNKSAGTKIKTIPKIVTKHKKYSDLKIGIALDQAFGFYYPDDLDKFKSYGVKIIYFNKYEKNYLSIFLSFFYPSQFLWARQ